MSLLKFSDIFKISVFNSRSSIFVYYIGTFILVFLRFLQNVLVARYSGPEEMGVFLGALILPQLLSRIYDFSLGHAFVYEIRLDRNNFSPAMATLILHYLILSPFIFLSAFLMRYYPFDDKSIIYFVSENISCVSIVISSALIVNIISSLFVAEKNYLHSTLILLASPIVFIFSLIFMHGDHRPIDSQHLLERFAFSEAVGVCFAMSLGLVRARRCAPNLFRLQSRFYKYGVRAHGGMIAKVTVARLDRAIVATFLPPNALALYSLAASFRDIAQIPATTYINIFYSKFISLIKKEGKYIEYFYKILAFWGAFVFIFSVLFYFLSETVVHVIYGDEFIDSAQIFVILSIGNFGTILSGFCWTAVMALGRPGISTISIIVGAIIGIPLMLMAVYFFQLDGAAWGSVANSLVLLVTATAGLWVAHKTHKAIQILGSGK